MREIIHVQAGKLIIHIGKNFYEYESGKENQILNQILFSFYYYIRFFPFLFDVFFYYHSK